VSGLDARGLPAGYPYREDLEVTPRAVREMLAAGAVYLVDCRTKAEAATARIDGAVLIPLDELAGQAERIEEDAGALPVVVHCHMGGRSMKAALFLRGRGIEAKSMAGGIDVWSVDIDPRVARY
jgi:rhodanese-related sulfurtransferase